MATLGSKLITKQMPWHANMTDQNHLGKALSIAPHVIGGKMNQLFSSQNLYSNNPLSSELLKKGAEMEIGELEWEWQLKGANTRPLVVIENMEPVSNTTPGKGKVSFNLKLDKDWFVAGDVLNPGTANKKYQVRVVGKPKAHGDGFVYSVRMNSDVFTDYIPVTYLTTGQQWSKLFSTYGEAARDAGSVQFSGTMSLRNSLSSFRKRLAITDLAANQVLKVGIPDSKGAYHMRWMNYAEVEFWTQWYEELERARWYTRKAVSVTDESTGRPVIQGAGIQEQLEDSHVATYSKLTGRFIEEYLMDIFYGRVAPGSGREIKGYTGEYGMKEFHSAMVSWMNKNQFVTNVEVFTSNESSPYHNNAVGAGYQFVKFSMANGTVLELIHNPLYDNREINYEIDELTGKPVESQRFTFLDFAGKNTSNIKTVKKKDARSFVYVAGTIGPYGPRNNQFAAHSGGYYEMTSSDMCGMHIEDITACGELILKRS